MDGSADGAAGDEAAESLVDKLRSDDYGELVKSAQQAQEAQLCLQANGNVVKADPHRAFAPGGVSQAPPVAALAPAEDPEEELRRLRQARIAQLKEEQAWKAQGHGSLRKLADEREFVAVIGPHERAVVLLDDGSSSAGQEVHKVLDRLAPKHLEAQFCLLPADRAQFLTRMVDLEGLPAVFVLRDGQVTRHLPPSVLFERSSASSPLFAGHLASMLLIVGAITASADGKLDTGSEDGDRSDDEEAGGRHRLTWHRR